MSADTLAIFGLPSPVATSAHSGVSPSNSSAEDFEFDMAGEDDDEQDFSAFAHILGQPDSKDQTAIDDGTGKKRSRRPPSTAAKRATHNAVERARRESLNGRFMELAHVLPNMSMSKRPSKNSIVEHAIEYVGQADRRDKALTAENASLLAELNTLRAQLGMPARAALDPIVEAPTGKPPSKRPSTVQNPPAKAKVAPVAAPAPIVTSSLAKNPAEISPRTVSAPAVMPATHFPPAFDWTGATQGFDAFNTSSFDGALYTGTQTGGGQFVYAWPLPTQYMVAPMAPVHALA